jgi:hypothetical protein
MVESNTPVQGTRGPRQVKTVRIPQPMDDAGGLTPHAETMEPAVFEYPRCALRDACQAVAAAFPPLRAVAAPTWPAARRADRVAVSEDGIEARTLAGHESIAWGDVAAVRRTHTTWGRITVHVIARTGSQIEIAETNPGFDELAAMLRRPWLRLAA